MSRPKFKGPWWLTARDIVNLPAFVERLRQRSEGVSQFLWEGFGVSTRQLLCASPGSESNSNSLVKALVQELNSVIGGSLIYEKERFADVRLSEETQAFLNSRDRSGYLPRLNRLLLQDAYPLMIARRYRVGTIFDLPTTEAPWWPDHHGLDGLDRLIRRYLRALEAHLRARLMHRYCIPEHEVGDILITFANKLGYIARHFDPRRGRFRDLLKKSLQNHVRDWIGGHTPIPEELDTNMADEHEVEADESDICWARIVLAEALRRMKRDCQAKNQRAIWTTFRLRILVPLLLGTEPRSVPELKALLKAKDEKQVFNWLQTGKLKFSRFVRDVLSEYADTAEDIEEERRNLIELLRRGIHARRLGQSDSYKFEPHHLKDLASLVFKLGERSDGVSEFLWERFSDSTRVMFLECSAGNRDAKVLRLALVGELNTIIGGGLIFEKKRFAGVQLSERSRKILRRKPRGRLLMCLNRLLLEDAYPGQIVRHLNT